MGQSSNLVFVTLDGDHILRIPNHATDKDIELAGRWLCIPGDRITKNKRIDALKAWADSYEFVPRKSIADIRKQILKPSYNELFFVEDK
ncbi:MAG: hypothetical protein V4501_11360 [Pseudomonadota bacterium]